MKKPICYILVGVPGSGKSTFAKKWAQEDNIPILCADNIRKEILKDENSQEKSWLIFKILYQRANKYLKEGKDIIIDCTNVDKKTRKGVMKNIIQDCNFIALVKKVPIEICKERNKMRERQVSDEVIDKFYNKFTLPTIEEGFASIIIDKE